MRRSKVVALILALGLAAAPLAAAEKKIIAPWTGLGRNFVLSYSGSNSLLHLSGIAGTFLIVATGLDTDVHNFFAENRFMEGYSRPAVALGTYFPALLGAGLFTSGLISGGPRLATAGSAVLQAAGLSAAAMVTLKALTGRPGPDPVVYEDDAASKVWRFGFLRGGTFHGWPSGHVMTNTAAISSLMAFYKEKTWVNVVGGLTIGYMFLSVVSHHRSAMHWFSDAVAGALMGIAIGTTVGREFRRRFDEQDEKPSGVSAGAVKGGFAFTLTIGL